MALELVDCVVDVVLWNFSSNEAIFMPGLRGLRLLLLGSSDWTNATLADNLGMREVRRKRGRERWSILQGIGVSWCLTKDGKGVRW